MPTPEEMKSLIDSLEKQCGTGNKPSIQDRTLEKLARIRKHDLAKAAEDREADSIRRLARLTKS